ncbi:di-trans,poly-cis-decaprenylcistransferase [Candidatus Saccharibacteria bacterium]|nr:di-trans,poly-cis-decaprenylcistransferase [Candidatus Saccharibacteria bacterium]
MEENVLPKHLGFIVDGNRRWARERGLPTLEGHRRGIDLVADIAEECHKQGVKIVSFYIFSTENWNRSKEEVDYLMDLVEKCLKKFIKKCLKNDTRIAILGTKERLSQNLVKAVEEAEEKTKHCKENILGLCFNYGGKQEIVDAANKINGEVTIEKLEANLYHPEIPALDMVIRTSGEERISGFMLWRMAYAEMLFLDKKWPDMTKEDVPKILEEFVGRQRRFGK